MAVFEVFSRRLRKAKQAGLPVIYTYDELPEAFRNQVGHLWRDSAPCLYEEFGGEGPNFGFWRLVESAVAKELGLRSLASANIHDPLSRCISFFSSASTEQALDFLEMSFSFLLRDSSGLDAGIQPVDDAITELNARFDEHSLGYQLEAGRLIRRDSQFLHAEVTSPVLKLLHEGGFKGPEEEFLKAHEHFLRERYKETLVEALKAFESTMKAICSERNLVVDPKDTAKDLIKKMVEQNVIPAELESHLASLRSTLESGLPTLRNRRGGHGQGMDRVVLPKHFAAYALHLAGTNMLFLLKCHLNDGG